MVCPNCGKSIADGAKFCNKCGYKIELTKNSLDSDISDSGSIGDQASHMQTSSLNDEEKNFVWKDKYSYFAIVGAIVLAAIIGFAVKMHKSSDNYINTSGSQEHLDVVGNEEQGEIIDYEEAVSNEMDDSDDYEDEEIIDENVDEVIEDEYDLMFDDIGIHNYELLVDDVSWTEAYEECLKRGGHLVRINSNDECETILQQINNEDKQNIKFWIGGFRDSSDEYRWVYNDDYEKRNNIILGDIIINGDSMYDDYWLDGEPSFYDEATGTEENRINMFYMKSLERWVFNDVPDDILGIANFYSGTIGYICEYE